MPTQKQTTHSAQKLPTKTRSSSVTPPAKTGGQGMGNAAALVERMGDERFAAAQRQTMAAQVGSALGNRQLMRMLNTHPVQPTPHTQRSLAGALLLGNVLAVKGAVQPTIDEKDDLRALNEAINDLGAESDRGELVKGLKSLRGRVAETVVASKLEIDDGLAKAIRQHFYLKLSRLAPFYTQVINKNILATKTTKAAMRTCNITTVAMTLEGLGKTAADFQGNSGLMNNIVSQLSLGTTEANTLRLPDFLQILAIYLAMTKKNKASTLNELSESNLEQFQNHMTEGAKEAANNILLSDLFNSFTKQFGVAAQSHTLDLNPALAVFGAYYRPFEGDLEDHVREKKKRGQDANVSKAEKEAFRAEFTAERKARYRKGGDKVGKEITKVGEALEELEINIATSKAMLTEYEEKLKTVNGEVATLAEQLVDVTSKMDAAADKSSQKSLRDQLAITKAASRAKVKERTGLEKKKSKLQKNLEALEDSKVKTLTKRAGLQLEQGAKQAVGSETNEEAEVEEALPIATYQNAVIPLMVELLGSGKQVIVNLHNHFVKLQDINTQSVIVHDSGRIEQDNKVVSWEECREKGYFKRYTVVG